MFSGMLPLSEAAENKKEQSRFCVGFLYCKESKGEATYTQAFLYLYSTEERGNYSRLTLIPFYSREMNPAEDYLRQSVLWPLGISEHKGDASYFQLLPMYWHAENPSQRYTIVLPAYFDYAEGDRSYTYLVPLYGHHQRGDHYHRYYVLGPVAIATYDTETDLREWDILFPLFHYGADENGHETRILPLYFSGQNNKEGTWYRYLFPFYGRSVTPQTSLSYVFPLYGLLTDTSTQETRTSILGLPPLLRKTVPTLAFYEHVSTPTFYSDRFFPLYRYSYSMTDDLRQLDLIVLFRMKTSPTLTAHRLFPLYFYEDDRQENRMGWSLLGIERFSLAGYGHDANTRWHQVMPLYRVTEDLATQIYKADVLGFGPLSIFRYWSNPEGFGHRLFPLYHYDHPEAEEWHWSALFSGPLSLYRHDAKGDSVHDRFFPLYDWRRNGDRRELSVIGVADFAMFHQESGPTWFANRLFPLYRYRHDLAADEVTMDTLFLHRHHSTPEKGDDRFLMLWEASWQRQQPGWELDLLGIKPATWFHHESSSVRTADRLFPFYGYQSVPTGEWRLSLLGFPPRERAFAWSLYEHGGSPTYLLTRLFPLYRYERNDDTKEVNWSALLLYRHVEKEPYLLDTLPPLHEYERNDETGTMELNLAGFKPITLFNYGRGPDARHSYLFPLYDYNRVGEASRFSMIGWPKVGSLPTLSLFEREDTSSLTAHRLFPIYRYRRDDEAKTRDWDAFFLWWHRETEQQMRDVFLPLVDIAHDRQQDERDVGVLGIRPLTFFRYQSSPTGYSHAAALLYKYSSEAEHQRLSVLGLPQYGSGPALSLFAMDQTPSAITHRLFPLYRYASDEQSQTLDWQALFLWWHWRKESHARTIILPLADMERDTQRESSRLSLVGVPRIGEMPPLTLFNWEQTPLFSTHRLFPLYQYSHDQGKDTTAWNALWLYWHRATPQDTRDTFFPLGSLWRDKSAQAWSLSALGVDPLSMAYFSGSPTSARNRLFPFWDYEREGNNWGFSLVGIRHLSLFGHDRTETGATDHLFPFWWYADSPTESRNVIVPLWSDFRNHQTQERAIGVLGIAPLSLYYQQWTPTGMTARLFPLWSREYHEQTQETHTGAIGIPPLSLYYGYTSPTSTENRLFPFFRYMSDHSKDESEFWFLWPFFDYKTAQGRTTETSMLWWLFHYRSTTKDEWEYWVLGHPPIALYMRTVSPQKTLVEVNPIIPGWRREYVEGVGTSWALFGGLIGMDAQPDGTHKLRLLWAFQL
ncbi:MAG: hypothetical protein OEY86_03585 [Nitrospira sp.]|nr:hypothetical protein [Nitrospira sp.]